VIIDRHNYEEFFLLYVDNELDETQRAEVEKFAQQNPDLAKELAMLKQTALVADENLQFTNKELLFKKEAGITLANYEEYFLLSIDNELTEPEKTEVEKFVLKHPELQRELALLQQTRLQPEAIEFTGKEVLYRTETKERRIIPWIRISVAAAIAGIAIALWMFTGNDKAPGGIKQLAINVKPSTTKPVTIENIETPVTKKGDASLSNIKEAESTTSRRAMANKEVKVKHESNRRLSPTKIKDNLEASEHNTDFATASTNPIDEKLSSNAIVAANHFNNNENVLNNNLIKTTDKQNVDAKKPIIHDAVYREVDNEEDDNTIYIGSAQINKNKLKALFKKAANLLDKKIGRNESENTVQIAAFEFKSK
jgi:hypothetical protein